MGRAGSPHPSGAGWSAGVGLGGLFFLCRIRVQPLRHRCVPDRPRRRSVAHRRAHGHPPARRLSRSALTMYRIVWEFEAEPTRAREFERAYGTEGVWVGLFRAADGFVSTELFRSTADPLRYLTVDRWTSRAAHEAFCAAHERAYTALDQQCAALTRLERLMARGD